MNLAGTKPVKDSLGKILSLFRRGVALESDENSCEILNTAYLVTLKLARVHIYQLSGLHSLSI